MVMLLASIMVFFSSCKKEKVDPQKQEKEEKKTNKPPTANAGKDLKGKNGETVQLNGSLSIDPDGDELKFTWTVEKKPDGSQATIKNASQAIANFIPDKVGVYTIKLTVKDEKNDPVSDEMTLTVEKAPIEIKQDISQNKVLEDVYDDETPDYKVTRSIQVLAELKIKPGVIVQVAEDATISINATGSILSEGTATKGVKITSTDADANVYWGGLIINSANSNNKLTYTTIESAGKTKSVYINGYKKANIGISESGKLNITNSVITKSNAIGIVSASANGFPTFTNNKITGNKEDALYINPNSISKVDNTNEFSGNGLDGVVSYGGDLTSNHTWVALKNNAPIVLKGNLNVKGNLKLTEGGKIQIAEEKQLAIATGASFISEGTASNRNTITSTNPSAEIKFGTINFESSDARNLLKYTDISHGGSIKAVYINGYKNASVSLNEIGKVSFDNSTISNGKAYGIAVASKATIKSMKATTFKKNENDAAYIPASNMPNISGDNKFDENGSNTITVYTSILDTKSTINKLDKSGAWRISGNLTIKKDVTIAAGTTIKLNEKVSIFVSEQGSLNATGTATEKITFTTSNLAGEIKWGSLVYNTGSSLNKLVHTTVSHGGNYKPVYINGYKESSIGVSNGKLEVKNTTISKSQGYGIGVASSGTLNGKKPADANFLTNVKDTNTFSDNAKGDVVAPTK